MRSESEAPAPALAELALVTRAYDFLLWLVHHVGKFPRSHRFVLGERIDLEARGRRGSILRAA